MESYVKLNHICKNFNHVKALNDASIEAFKGEVLAIVGDNGAGKSTLIKILSGVLRPDSGEIRIGEKCYSSLSVSEALNARSVYCVSRSCAGQHSECDNKYFHRTGDHKARNTSEG